MQLDEEVFEDQLGRLQAAHGRRVTSEASKYWYALCKDLDKETFLQIMDKLCYGDRFPTFGMFRHIRSVTEIGSGAQAKVEPRSRCRWCNGDGKLTIEPTDGMSQATLGRCNSCKLITDSNRAMMVVDPEFPPRGYVLTRSHIMNAEFYDKEKAEGRDPFAEREPVKGTAPIVGGASPYDRGKEEQREKELFKEKERDLQTWQDNY